MGETRKRIDELRLTGKLPSPSGVGLQLLRLVHGGEIDLNELVRLLSSDAAICGRVFKAANGSLASGVEPVRDVQTAVMRLGVDAVVRIGMSFSLVSAHRRGECQGFDYDAFWSASLLRAILGQTFGRELGLGRATDHFLVGLFREVGDLALATVHPERYEEAFAREPTTQDHQARRLKQIQVFGLPADAISAALIGDWLLPYSFGEAIVAHAEAQGQLEKGDTDEAPELLFVLNLTMPILQAVAAGEGAGVEHWQRIETARDQAGMESDVFQGHCEAVLEEWRSWCQDFRLEVPDHVPLSRLQERASGGEVPAAAAPPAEQETAADSGVANRPTRVLAIDDDPFSLRILSRHLERGGYEVIQAADGEEGLIRGLELDPEIVVSDWMMPGMDGLEVCRALRRCESGRRMHIILVTGRDDESRIVEAFDAGVNDYVCKPFKPRVLLARVRAGERTMQLKRQLDREKSKLERAMAEMAVLNRKFREASLTDPLTGLPNRRHAMLELAECWRAVEAGRAPLSVAMLDIDHFKSVNDEHGHDIGDEVLKETAAVAMGTMRSGEHVCRMGGEEFLAIYPRTRLADALVAAERLRRAIEGNRIRRGTFDRNVTVSIGVASSQHAPESVDALLKASDEAVYEAKRSGRNRVCAAGETVGVGG